MFGLLVDPIKNALSVVESVFDGDGPTKEQVAKLIDDGVSIAVIAATFGVAEDVITTLLDDSE